jgi:N-acetylglucosamine-6-phosphate deacetylase
VSVEDRLVLRGSVVAPDRLIADGVLTIAHGLIDWVGDASAWTATDGSSGWPEPVLVDGTILPGLVDVHCHGAAGHGFPDGDIEGSRTAARHHRNHGTTTLLASLVTASERDLLVALRTCAQLADAGEVAGIHLEGPFLSAVRCGAQDPSAIRDPDLGMLERLLDAGGGHVRTLTYAPELPGASALADYAMQRDVMPSVGHTDCDAVTARAAFAQAGVLGRSSVTHLFNGMPVMHHRSPGPAAASLAAAARGETVLELIADGVHLAPDTVAAVFDLVGPGQVALVSDAMSAAGLPDGAYRLGPADVEVVGGVARLAGGGPAGTRSIAGGTARLIDNVRHAVREAGVDLVDAVTAASSTPARLLGLEGVTGALRPGLRADSLVVDADLASVRVMVGGRWVHESAAG